MKANVSADRCHPDKRLKKEVVEQKPNRLAAFLGALWSEVHANDEYDESGQKRSTKTGQELLVTFATRAPEKQTVEVELVSIEI